jgi:hypothetical protein
MGHRLRGDHAKLNSVCSAFSGVNLEVVKTPERMTAAAFPRYAAGEVLADSAFLQWKGLFARRYRSPRVADRFLVLATPEPLVSCGLAG